MRIIITVIVLSLLFTKIALAQQITLTNKAQIPLNITSSVEIFSDTTAKLSLQNVTSQRFGKSPKSYFLFPYSDNIYWVRFTLQNIDNQSNKWFLLWGNPLVEQLDFYISDDSNMQHFVHKQQKLITSERDKPFVDQEPKFIFDLAANQTKTIYIKLTSKRGHYGMLRLHTAESYTKFRMDDFTGQGFVNGMMFFRLFLVLVLSFFIIKDSAFRLYSLYTIIRTFNYWGYLNIAGPLFTDNPDIAKKIDFLFYNSSTFGAGIFILVALFMRKILKIHRLIVIGFLVFTIFINTVIFFDYQWYWLKAGAYTLVFSAFYYIILHIYFIIKKTTFAKYYNLLFILGLLSTGLLYVRLLGWVEIQSIYTASYYFFLAEFFFFVFFLGRIFRNTELNKTLTEQRLKLNIEQNDKLKELDNIKTQFFTNISHELRTPVTLLTAPIQELLVKYPTDRLLPLMNRNAQRLLTLINQLLDISKLEAGQMKVEMSQNNVSKYLNTLVGSFTSLAVSKGIKFQFTQSKQDVEGYIDEDKIEKIILNLLSNAFKFTPEGGEVKVSIHFSDDSRNLTCTISDTGIGISEEKLPKIFDRFYQADASANRNYEGTGIGLTLVKELVEVLKGRISVVSQTGKGTTFMLNIPIDYETWKEEIIASHPRQEELKLHSKFVEKAPPLGAGGAAASDSDILLIVDDNPDIRTYVRSIFESSYQIIEAINGEDGIQKAQETTPNLIISDLMMPQMDGFEFCKYLKSNELTSHIPVIMLTAKANVESRIEGLEMGADDYLIKPFNAKEIQVRVKNLLEKQETLRQYFTGKTTEQKPAEMVKIRPIEAQFLAKAKSIIEKHLSENTFGIEEFCEEINMSSKQLLRKLKALTNQTTVEFIREYRLQRASEMLEQGERSVSDVAFAVGIESLSYFTKTFQEKFGCLPSEYVEKMGISE
jgi:signal transduction histidine kinase/DNA-binding response OmpR family regulator